MLSSSLGLLLSTLVFDRIVDLVSRCCSPELLAGACLTLLVRSFSLEELERVLTGDLTSVSRVFVLLRVSTRVGEVTELRCLSVSVLTSVRDLGVALLRSACRVLTSVEGEVGVRTDVRCCTEEEVPLDLTEAGDDLV